jgi:hypothetical protein
MSDQPFVLNEDEQNALWTLLGKPGQVTKRQNLILSRLLYRLEEEQ